MALLLSLAAVLFCALMTPRQSGCAHKDTATVPPLLITAVIINNIPLSGELRRCPAGRPRPGAPQAPQQGGGCCPQPPAPAGTGPALPGATTEPSPTPAGTVPAQPGAGAPHGPCQELPEGLRSARLSGLCGTAGPEKSKHLLICLLTVMFCLFPASKALVL